MHVIAAVFYVQTVQQLTSFRLIWLVTTGIISGLYYDTKLSLCFDSITSRICQRVSNTTEWLWPATFGKKYYI